MRPVNAWAVKYVPVTALLPPDMPPECQAKLDAYRAEKEKFFSFSSSTVNPSLVVPQLKNPTYLTFSFGKVLLRSFLSLSLFTLHSSEKHPNLL